MDLEIKLWKPSSNRLHPTFQDITILRYLCELDLGSDHRCVSASIEYIRSTEAWKTRKRSFKGWKPIRDEARQPHEYHSQLETMMNDQHLVPLQEFGKIALEAAPRRDLLLHGTNGLKRLMKSMALKDPILQKKETSNIHDRKVLSRQIHKQIKKELRLWKAK